ncbi:MAG: hypothetical protein ACP5D9_02325 [Mariniphaga sp.]
MTAVIGIFNKSGVALAADSAVTISGGNGRKIYNNAYKIFSLSKFHPVAIMIYNSATFMDIPWEIIIKEYRKKIKKDSFNTLNEYESDFISFVKTKTNLVSSEFQNTTLEEFIKAILKDKIESVFKNNLKLIEKEKSKSKQKELIKSLLIEDINKALVDFEKEEKLSEFDDYMFSSFIKKHKTLFKEPFNKFYSELKLGRTNETKIQKYVFNIITTANFWGAWTGLVLVGFGENEIYASCKHIRVGEVFENRIRYRSEENGSTQISEKNRAAIMPYAQRDVIDTILTGIDNKLEDVLLGSHKKFLVSFINRLKTIVEPENEKLAKKIGNIDVNSLIRNFIEEFNEIQRKLHIVPLIASIASLSKEDLAELAESLVYLTYLKRRMSGSEESVGGPIDVAIITKGDGLVWIKRKHYFDISLNQDFITKYLNY